MKFIIIHGSFGTPEENWFPYLSKKLAEIGQEVIVPGFPIENWQELTNQGPENAVAKNQNLNKWLETFEKNVLPKIDQNEKVCMIGHSLGAVFILHTIDKFNINLDNAIFVSPFLRVVGDVWQFTTVNNSFYKDDFDFDKLHKLIPISYTLYSDNDPYVPIEKMKYFAESMNSSPIIIRGGGHLDEEAGFKEFPLIFELCKTRLSSTKSTT